MVEDWKGPVLKAFLPDTSWKHAFHNITKWARHGHRGCLPRFMSVCKLIPVLEGLL